jgi:hypothetical protein
MTIWHRLCLLPLVALVVGGWAGAAQAATFTVTNTNNAGTGSLRAAIVSANATTGLDTIRFAIPGSGPYSIPLTTTLPP